MVRHSLPPPPDRSASTPLEAGLVQIQDELDLALQWSRPSIVLVVAASERTRRTARAMLYEWLELRGERVERFSVARKENQDIPLLLSRKHLLKETVYFV